MFGLPVLAGVQRCFADELFGVFVMDWDGEPGEAAGGFDFVSVAPVVFGVLEVVVEDEDVYAVDDVKVAAPGDIVGLDDAEFHFLFCGFKILYHIRVCPAFVGPSGFFPIGALAAEGVL